jgi:membrane protease YdiL (CAAX protease family)
MNPLLRYRSTGLFYGLSTAIPWAFWLAAARISHLSAPPQRLVALGTLFGLLGILAPAVVAACLILPDRALRADVAHRMTNFGAGWPRYWALASLIMPSSILLAIALSLPLGFSVTQFHIASHASFQAGTASPWAVLIIVPVIEELAWHTYGTDTLRRRHSLFATCVIFAVYWGLWHAPLMLVNGYYHSNLLKIGMWELGNFFVSIIPVAFLMNWIYYRAGRNIWIAALFHVTSGFFNELFSPDPRTKLIQTGVLLVVAVVVVVRERHMFFAGQATSG